MKKNKKTGRQLFFSLLLFVVLLSSFCCKAQKQGQARIDSLSDWLRHAKDDSNKAANLIHIGFIYATINPDSGIRYALIGNDLSARLEWERGKAEAFNIVGINYAYKSDFGKSIEYWNKAMVIYEKLGSKEGMLKIIGNIGNIYSSQGDFPKALENDLKALQLSEEIGNTRSITINLGNIGAIYEDLGKFDKALEYDFKALNMSRKSGDKVNIALNLGNIGNVYMDQKEYKEALKYDLEALKVYEELGMNEGVGRNMLNIGRINMALDELSGSLEYGFKSLRLFYSLDYKIGVGKAQNLVGETYSKIAANPKWDYAHYRQVGHHDINDIFPSSKAVAISMALKYLDSAIANESAIGELDDLHRSYLMLSQAQVVAGDYKNALESYKKYTINKDSVYSTANKIKITNLESQRELDLKDKQIVIDKLEVAKKHNERVFFIGGLLLLLSVLVIIFRNYKVQKVLNKLLTVEKHKVEERTEELKETNNELHITLENLKATQAQLVKTEKQKENEMIRSRISQDIHDDISSELTKISWVTELAKAKAKKDGHAEVAQLMDKITLSSRDTVTKLGEIIWTVNPVNDTLGSLLSYMRNHISRFLEDTPFAYAIYFPDVDTDMPVNPELKRNLFLAMKEALNNAVKYANAKNIQVSFSSENAHYVFTIADDGIGLNEHIIQGGGNGLKNMRKRMESVKGNCEIITGSGAGTRIVLSGTFY